MPLATGVRLGPYEITAWIGAGGMGDVYRAVDKRLGRIVAIKVPSNTTPMTSTRRERFTREARAISRLSHPGICALHDVGEHAGVPFIVMEYLEGEMLSQRLARGPLPGVEIARVGADIADALHHAHRHGIVHRDLKPSNVMLTPNGVKLLDFGLARLGDPAPDETSTAQRAAPSLTETLTDEELILGTVQYMAPEQLEGRRVDGRTDIFALGAVLHEMGTGRPLFAGPSKASIIAAVLERQAPPLSAATDAVDADTLSPLLDGIVARCLAKVPDDRWQTAGDLCQALKCVTTIAHPHRPGPPRQPAYGGGWWMGSALLAAAAVAVMLIWPGSSAPPSPGPSRWIVTAPEGSAFDPSGYSLAVSPDGAHVAFIASSTSGENALWVRSLDSVVPRKLADGAAQPFWSFDSRSIAFGSGGQLEKVDLATGLVEPLADAFVQSGAWNRDGVLLLGLPFGERRYNPRGLYKVSAAGGPLARATTTDADHAEFNHIQPQFLPDGRRFLFLSRSRDPRQDGMLYAGSLDSPERIPLFHSRSRAVYASGYLLFSKDQTLVAQRFDPAKLRLEGAPAIVAENVEQRAFGAAFSASDTGVLAYRPETETELVWFDRSGTRLEAVGDPGHYADPGLSADERHVVVSRKDTLTGQADVWVIDLARGLPSKLTFSEASEGTPLVSPDGGRVVYRSGSSLVMKAMNGTGSEERLADRLTNFDHALDWSTDGRALLYTSFDSTSSTDLWLLPIDGRRPRVPLRRTGSRWGVQARVSPDGRWLAYASNERGRYDVYVRPFPSGDGKWLITPGGGSEPAWRRDGKELFYLAPDGAMTAVTVTTEPTFRASPPMRLFRTRMSTLVNTSIVRNQYVASADGRRFLVNQPIGPPPSIVVVVDWPAGLKSRQ